MDSRLFSGPRRLIDISSAADEKVDLNAPASDLRGGIMVRIGFQGIVTLCASREYEFDTFYSERCLLMKQELDLRSTSQTCERGT